MRRIPFIIFSLSVFLSVEATINVCIPLQSTDVNAINTNEIFHGIKDDVTKKLSKENGIINLGDIDLDLSHPAIRVKGKLENVVIHNPFDFQLCLINNINSTTNTLDLFNLTFANITVKGDYNITGDVGDLFDIYGAGDFRVQLIKFSIAMTDFTISNVTTEVCFPINIDVDFYRIKSHFNNLMYDEELEDLFNKAIEAIGPEALKMIWSDIKDVFDKPIEDAINGIFHQRNVYSLLTKAFINPINDDWIYCSSSNTTQT